jgi:hypothetical protein
LIKLYIKRRNLNFPSNVTNRSIDPNVPIEPLVVNILYHESYISLDNTIAAGVDVDLLQTAVSLGQVLAASLNNFLSIVVFLALNADWNCCQSEYREFVAVRALPFWKDYYIVFARFKIF